METSSGGRDSRFSMGYNISLLSEGQSELYGVHSRPGTSITSGLGRAALLPCSGPGPRGLKRPSSDLCYDQDRQMSLADCPDLVDETYSPAPQKGSPPANGKKTKGRVKIKMEYIDNKLRRYTTFSKRKTGIMKKAYELSTLTGTQVMLLVASETGHVYTFATRKLQPMITSEAGKALIQTCLNGPDPCGPGGPAAPAGDQRMSATGFEETELSYNIAEEEQKEGGGCSSPGCSEPASPADSSSSASPPPPPVLDLHQPPEGGRSGRRSPPPSHLPPAPHSPLLNPRTSVGGGGGGGVLGYGGGSGVVYAAAGPSPGPVIFSVPGQPPHYITIPVLAPTDLSKPSKSSSSSSSGSS